MPNDLLKAVREVALIDLMSTTDEELREESLNSSEDIEAIAKEVKAGMREALISIESNLNGVGDAKSK